MVERPTWLMLMLMFRQVVVRGIDDVEKMTVMMTMIIDVDDDDNRLWHGLVTIPVESAESFTVVCGSYGGWHCPFLLSFFVVFVFVCRVLSSSVGC